MAQSFEEKFRAQKDISLASAVRLAERIIEETRKFCPYGNVDTLENALLEEGRCIVTILNDEGAGWREIAWRLPGSHLSLVYGFRLWGGEWCRRLEIELKDAIFRNGRGFEEPIEILLDEYSCPDGHFRLPTLSTDFHLCALMQGFHICGWRNI